MAAIELLRTSSTSAQLLTNHGEAVPLLLPPTHTFPAPPGPPLIGFPPAPFDPFLTAYPMPTYLV